MRFAKRNGFERAIELLSTEDDSLLRYACLELRFCMEEIVYAKLQTYSSRLPKKVLNKWQPPQAVRALLLLEPQAVANFELAVAIVPEPGAPPGPFASLVRHRSIDPGWLQKNYHKVGNLLHACSLNSAASQLNPVQLRKYIHSIIEELRPVVSSTLDSSFAEIVSFKCSECGETSSCNHEGVLKSRCATCLNPSCEAEFFVVDVGDGELRFDLRVTNFKCTKCDSEIPLESRSIKIGKSFKCMKCWAEHRIGERLWTYAPAKEVGG